MAYETLFAFEKILASSGARCGDRTPLEQASVDPALHR